MIGRMHHVVIDTREPARLAAFYSALLDLPVTYRSPDWVVVSVNDHTSGLAFQLAPDHHPPDWPDPNRPQQSHLDIMVDDVEAGIAQVIALGARRLQDSIFADPAGHPFCLIPRPGWARPVQSSETRYGFYRHRRHPDFRLVLPSGDSFPAGTGAEEWTLSRERREDDVNADVLAEIRARGYSLFRLAADLSQIPDA